MPQSNRIILTDVDGVLLEWEHHFTKWMLQRTLFDKKGSRYHPYKLLEDKENTYEMAERFGITIPEIDTTNWTAPEYNVDVAAAEFTQLATLIDTEEDVELAMAKIQEISAIIQNELNEFNEINTAYQADIAKAVQDAQFVSAAESQDIQRYGAQLQAYQADIQKEVTAFTSNLQMIGGEHSAMMQEMQALQAQYQFGLSTLTGAAQ